MVDPVHITNYGRTDDELEELALFCVTVAFRNALFVAEALDRILAGIRHGTSPFGKIRWHAERHDLARTLHAHGIGLHNRKAGYLKALVNSGIDLRACAVRDLETLPGVGPKTARFFVLHTRPKVRVACLDTHILKFLRAAGCDVPGGSPSGRTYLRLEEEFLKIADREGRDVAEFDLELWNRYRKGE